MTVDGFRCGLRLQANMRNAVLAASTDKQLQEYLDGGAVDWRLLDDRAAIDAELRWRTIYAEAFLERPRLLQGVKAEISYSQTDCTRYLIVPFISKVIGLPVQEKRTASISGYECSGTFVSLGRFCSAEFFVCPLDFAWSMIHTHEDHGLGGPYFIRAEWIP